MPSAATFANARWSAVVDARSASSPNSSAPAHGSSTATQRFAREARLQRVDEDRDERRSRAAAVVGDDAARSSDQLPEQALERVVERAHLEQADRLVAREPGQRGRQLARLQRSGSRARRAPGRTSRRRPSRARSATTPAAGRRRSARARAAGRSSIASRIAWWPPAAASRPLMSTITRSARRSTSLSTCELTITVRPCAPSCLNSAMRCTRCTGSAPFSGSSSTSTCGIAHERGRDLRALAHALAEGVDAAGRRRRASRPIAARVSGALAVGDAVEVGDVAHELARGEPGRAPLRPRGPAPARRNTSRSRRGSRPSMRTVPWLTSMRPVIARISVVLPAPLGPSRPVTPGPERAAELRQRDLLAGTTPTRRRRSRSASVDERRIVACAARSGATSSFHPAVAAQEHRDAGDQHHAT